MKETAQTGNDRHFRAPDGAHWLVREVESREYDRRESRSLVFSCDEQMVMRRVRSYPANWITLNDDALYALSLTR